jgi:hypothetical protein
VTHPTQIVCHPDNPEKWNNLTRQGLKDGMLSAKIQVMLHDVGLFGW